MLITMIITIFNYELHKVKIKWPIKFWGEETEDSQLIIKVNK